MRRNLRRSWACCPPGPSLRATCQTSGISALDRVSSCSSVASRKARQVANGARGLLYAFRHQRPQPETPCMILHPAGLKRGVLAVITEHEQPGTLRVMHHVLCQHMDIGDIDGSHGSSRFAVLNAGPSLCTAGQTASDITGIVLVVRANRMKHYRARRHSAVAAVRKIIGMGGTASAAKVQRGGAFDWLIIIIVAGANEPVHQHYAFAFVGFFQRWPIWGRPVPLRRR